MAIQVKVPALGESVKQAKLLKWHKRDGDFIATDEPLCELETDKANTDLTALASGTVKLLKKEGDTVDVDAVIAEITPSSAPAAKAAARAENQAEAKAPSPVAANVKTARAEAASSSSASSSGTAVLEDYSPAVRRLIQENNLDPSAIKATGPSGRLTKEDVEGFLTTRVKAQTSEAIPFSKPVAPTLPEKKKETSIVPSQAAPAPGTPPIVYDESGVGREKLSRIRKRIAETLVLAQQTAAILTTFNELDLTQIIELRARYKERFQEVYGIGLGFMSFFAKACVLALKEFPRVNAYLEEDELVYHQYVHLGIAVSTDRGLAVPVLRNVHKMSFAKIESEIKRLATATRDGKLSLDELTGGTFTITNGGVFGSLLSTPILNPPQSGILGMHAIQKRPMVVNDKIEIRSMMYVALSYDHRIVDGRESVSFLVKLKQYLEDPARLMLEI
jgi:2-oxoglutarate dehydrogenase E2 component (dihydrolipoamide succinyltransferase)